MQSLLHLRRRFDIRGCACETRQLLYEFVGRIAVQREPALKLKENTSLKIGLFRRPELGFEIFFHQRCILRCAFELELHLAVLCRDEATGELHGPFRSSDRVRNRNQFESIPIFEKANGNAIHLFELRGLGLFDHSLQRFLENTFRRERLCGYRRGTKATLRLFANPFAD